MTVEDWIILLAWAPFLLGAVLVVGGLFTAAVCGVAPCP